MSGIYLHVPFCKKACHYCNFHFSTSLTLKEELVNCLCRELEIRKDYLPAVALDSIYFGGGTPSLLNEIELIQILETIDRYYTVGSNAEITLEANPDDLSREALRSFRGVGINRLSIGVQSFFDEDLRWMNRSHTAADTERCLEDAREEGFDTLTIDLMYGSPTTTDEMWMKNLEKAVANGISHLSAYCLTVEEKTALHHFIRTNKTVAPDAEDGVRQFQFLQTFLSDAGYVHYEISNFCLPGHEAKHNTSYWKGKPYLGVGPSAHSYDGKSRSWNIAHNTKYIEAIKSGLLPLETEILTSSDRYNEYIMTGLRTMWGVSLEVIREMGEPYHAYFMEISKQLVDAGSLRADEGVYTLNLDTKAFADGISSQLFYVD